MDGTFVTLTAENLKTEHLCCIIRTRKPHPGVEAKRAWLAARLPSVLTSTLGGHLLGTKNYGVAAAVFGATALFSLAGLLLYRRKYRREDAQAKAADEPAPPAEKAG